MTIRTRIAALTLAATAVVGLGSMSPASAVAGDPSQWGRDNATVAREGGSSVSAERKVNEYEGQHRKVNEYEGKKVNEYEGQHR